MRVIAGNGMREAGRYLNRSNILKREAPSGIGLVVGV